MNDVRVFDDSDDEWVCPTRMVESMVLDCACAGIACTDCGANRGVPCDRDKSKEHGRQMRHDDVLRLTQ